MGIAIVLTAVGAAFAVGKQSAPRSAAQDWLFACGTTPFSLDVFEGPTGAESGDDPAARALRKLLRAPFFDGLPDEGYRVLTSHADYVEYGAGKPRRRGFAYVALAKDEDDGEWVISTYGSCTPFTFIDREGIGSADWKLSDPKSPLAERQSRVKALLTERACASGKRSDDRIRPPRVSYGARRIVILALVKRRPGAQTCPGNPQTKYTFRLDEPIGDRVLVDGAEYPFTVRRPRATR